MSIVSLLLCFSMLLGTTYAWFTDSATSSGNKIVAGTLDVELWLHNEDGSTNIGDSGTPIFGVNSDSLATADSANTVWEPGKTQTVYLSIKNVGNLDLKYAVAIEVTNATRNLEDYMEYKITPDAKYGQRVEWTTGKKVTEGTNPDAKDVFLGAGQEHFFALSVHMDELATNAQMNGTIEFDIKVLATQVASESDSLGSGYDAGATYPSVNTEKVPTNAPAEGTPISNDNVTVVVPKTAEAGNYALEVANKKVVTDNGNGEGEINLDITLKKDGVKVSGDTYTVRVKIAKEGTPLNIAKVTHNGEEIAESKYNYDKSTGYITFTTTHFSPFVITYYDSDLSVNLGADATPEQKAEAMGEKLANLIAKGGKFTLNENVIVDESIVIPEGVNVVLDLNGYSISGATGMTSPVVFNYGILDMKNGTVNATETTAIRNSGVNAKLNMSNMSVLQTVAVNPEWLGTAVFTANGATTTINSGNYVGISSAAIVATSGGHLIINGGNFASNDSTVRVDSWSYGSYMTINGGTFNVNVEGARALYADGYKNVEINSGIFNGTIDSTYTNININGGTFNKSIKQPGGHQNKYAIRGGNFVEDVTSYLVDGFKVQADVGGYYMVIPSDRNYVTEGLFVNNAGDTYYVYSANGLKAIADMTNAQIEVYPFTGKTVLLMNDIDLGGMEWTPIGNNKFTRTIFTGTFDGQGYTVSNFKVTAKHELIESSYGFFGNVRDAVIKNLTIKDATVAPNGGRFAGVLVGRLHSGVIENCHVVDSSATVSHWQAGGIVGQANSGTISGCSAVNTTVTGYAGVGAIVGFQMAADETVISNCFVKDCTIAQNGSFGGDYDDMFAAVIGCVNNSDAVVKITNARVEGTTVKGNASSAVYGYLEEGAKLFIDGYECVSDGIFKNGVEYRIYNANGLATINAMMANKTAGRDVVITLMNDIDFSGKTWTPVDSHADSAFEIAEINGNGHTIYNLTINGQAMFTRFAGTGDVVIKDITFDGANVNSNGAINTSILTVQTYQNTLLDNVDVKNSTITGGYKVAPLIGSVYNENPSSIVATVKNCDVSDTVVTATTLDFFTCGMIAFVYTTNNDYVEYENCSITNVQLYAPNAYSYHANIHYTSADTDDQINEHPGVTVTNVTFENI